MNVFIADINGSTASLTAEESWHCSRVLRNKAGDEVSLIDGKGSFYKARLQLVSDKRCLAEILSGPIEQVSRPYTLHLAVSPTKNMDRMEWMTEKAVEIGVDELSFIQCKHSERTVIKTDRIRKIVESAVKQSLQATIPRVNDLLPFDQFMMNRTESQRLLAHCGEGTRTAIKQVSFANTFTLVMIGPEGDFSTQEVEQASRMGFNMLDLGHNRLRTETAGLFVCQAAALLS